ncbi:MAG TPA: DUF2283 domain-containing protein [Candidatus Taylorbacteria bacterium]|nr:MAG: hypothetical protein UY03_C0018G0019 [Parcubacteria group bacterium GW2011_GWA2_47_64]KKU97176.1 MAG: hypothetical protein UY29_C0002G0073 [Parcubacteria group bacterium GW2011_GWC2_48_17]HBV01625.1 DUF2283 domain-containing protein [Candidatus Taylorbacteria bacterium]
MKITYDKTVDALNVTLRRGAVARTIEFAPDVMLDFDKKGNVVHVEIIGSGEKF